MKIYYAIHFVMYTHLQMIASNIKIIKKIWNIITKRVFIHADNYSTAGQ